MAEIQDAAVSLTELVIESWHELYTLNILLAHADSQLSRVRPDRFNDWDFKGAVEPGRGRYGFQTII